MSFELHHSSRQKSLLFGVLLHVIRGLPDEPILLSEFFRMINIQVLTYFFIEFFDFMLRAQSSWDQVWSRVVFGEELCCDIVFKSLFVYIFRVDTVAMSYEEKGDLYLTTILWFYSEIDVLAWILACKLKSTLVQEVLLAVILRWLIDNRRNINSNISQGRPICVTYLEFDFSSPSFKYLFWDLDLAVNIDVVLHHLNHPLHQILFWAGRWLHEQ